MLRTDLPRIREVTQARREPVQIARVGFERVARKGALHPEMVEERVDPTGELHARATLAKRAHIAKFRVDHPSAAAATSDARRDVGSASRMSVSPTSAASARLRAMVRTSAGV